MKRKDRGSRPSLRPVQHIELPQINVKMRWIVIVVLLSIAAVALGRGVYALVSVEPGWHTVEVASKEPNTSQEFILRYDFSDAGADASARLRQLSDVYRQASEDAHRIFSAGAQAEESRNLNFLSTHVNETVRVDPALYRALEVLGENRHYLFLAPAYVEYNRVFLCQDDAEAARYDPTRDQETGRWLKELTAFTGDPSHISLELLGDSQVRLNVSGEYLAFAEEYGIEAFLDFGWMKNAFVADYLAEVLIQSGFTNGYLASYDGFTRNLDSRGTDYAVSFFDRRGNDVYGPVSLHYSGPMSLVYLRDFPLSDRDRWHYYAYDSGEILTAMLDPADAGSKASIPALLGYAPDRGCAAILMELLPVFVADAFDARPLEAAAGQGLHSLYVENGTLRHTQPDARLDRMEKE